MFKKLKKKFILINMLLLTTVFIGIFGAIYMITAYNMERDMEMRLKSSMYNPPKPIPQKEKMDMSIVIDLDNLNNVVNISSRINIDDWSLDDITKEIVNNRNEMGRIKINSESYSYLKKGFGYNNKIVLISRAYQQEVLLNLFEVFIFVGLISLIVLFLISIYFTNKTIIPLEETFIKQKQFIADASHELRTPLTIIKTNISLLEENKKNTIESQEKWIRYIDSQANRMSTLINEMLILANLDMNNNIGKFANLNLSKLLNNMLLIFEVVIFENGLILNEDIDDDIFIVGQKEQIKKLISILIDNAIKYTNKGGSISVTLKLDKNKVKLIVKNTGEGIANEHLEKIFERFYRIDTSRGRETGGYGLGLSIAKSIVEDCKGRIYAESILDENVSFVVELPIENKR